MDFDPRGWLKRPIRRRSRLDELLTTSLARHSPPCFRREEASRRSTSLSDRPVRAAPRGDRGRGLPAETPSRRQFPHAFLAVKQGNSWCALNTTFEVAWARVASLEAEDQARRASPRAPAASGAGATGPLGSLGGWCTLCQRPGVGGAAQW